MGTLTIEKNGTRGNKVTISTDVETCVFLASQPDKYRAGNKGWAYGREQNGLVREMLHTDVMGWADALTMILFEVRHTVLNGTEDYDIIANMVRAAPRRRTFAW